LTYIEKRYLRATGSSHLRADEHHEDVDTIIAAGSSGETLASALIRVRGEYDAIRGDDEQARRVALAHEVRAKDLEARAVVEMSKMNRGPTRAQLYRNQARDIRKESADEQLTSHALILVRMKTLPIAASLVFRFTCGRAQELGIDADPNELAQLSSKVLQAFIAPRCAHCGGRGFTGGHRQPAIRCSECKETGALLLDWGPLEHQLFGRQLLARIDEKVENLRRHMARRTRDQA
jgi:hypothetical protein